MNLTQSQVNLKEKIFFSKTIYNKKTERGAKITPPVLDRVKNTLVCSRFYSKCRLAYRL